MVLKLSIGPRVGLTKQDLCDVYLTKTGQFGLPPPKIIVKL